MQLGLENDAVVEFVSRSVPPEMAATLRAKIGRIEAIMTEYRTAAADIRQSSLFTDEGKRSQLGDLAERTYARVAQLKDDGKGWADHIAQLEQSIAPRARTGDAMLRLLEEQEVRRRVAHLDQTELQALYIARCADGGSGSDVFCQALEADPLQELLSEETREQGIQLRAERQSPAEASKLQQLRQVLDAYESAHRAAVAELEKGGYPNSDALRALAG